MSQWKSALIILLISRQSWAADPKWLHFKSDHFEMYSSDKERDSRETLRNFETVRAFFLQWFKNNPGGAQPVYLIGFGSEKEYAPYRPNEVAFAYYTPGADRDYIVMSNMGPQYFTVAVHEYVHLMVKHAGWNFPVWLNEGLADFYSTLQPRGNKILIGDLIQGHMMRMNQEKWVPLATILEAGHDSPYYNEKARAGGLYSESWALVHMLTLSKEYRPKYSDFLTAILDGVPSVTALEKTYGKPIKTIESDLQSYLHSTYFMAGLVDATLDRSKNELKPVPADPVDVELNLIDLVNRPGKEGEVRSRWQAVSRQSPQRPEPWAGLAYLEWRGGSQDAAVENMAKAFALGARNPRLLWDLGRLARGRRNEEAVQALEALSALQPDRVEVKLEIAQALMSARKTAAAYDKLRGISRIGPADATRLFTLLAFAQIQLGSPEAARPNVEKAAKYAQTDGEKVEVQRLQSYFDQIDEMKERRQQALQPMATEVRPDALLDAETPGEPRLLRRTPQLITRTETGAAIPLPSIAGTFTEFVCDDQILRLVLNTREGRKMFVIEDPANLIIVGKEGGKVDLQCGPQQPVPIRIEFGPLSKRIPGAEAAAKVVYFE